MTLDNARDLARRIIDNPKSDFRPADAVQAYNALCEGGEDVIADDLFEAVPNAIQNYDAKGNWVGDVSNENGWTA